MHLKFINHINPVFFFFWKSLKMADPASWAPSTVVIMNIFWLSHTNLITFFKKAMQHIPREIIKVDLFNRVVALICRRVFTCIPTRYNRKTVKCLCCCCDSREVAEVTVEVR